MMEQKQACPSSTNAALSFEMSMLLSNMWKYCTILP
jgi:hypothetical protein